jgi:FG-GAP-like repeat
LQKLSEVATLWPAWLLPTTDDCDQQRKDEDHGPTNNDECDDARSAPWPRAGESWAGSGGLHDSQLSQAGDSPFGVGAGPFSVAVGDFNLDGKPDLAVANQDSNNVTILLGDGMGGFTQPSSSPVGVGTEPQSVAAGDFNLDGKPDLATANLGSVVGDSSVTILLNTCSNAPPTVTLPPVITLRPAIELWPPDHKYHIITIAQMVQSISDDSDGNLFNNVVIEKVTSDEPDDASRKADGTTINDIVIAGDCKSVRLRSERDGKKNGRVYSVTLRVGDSSGNVTRRDFKVSVPHDRGAPAVEDATAMTITSNCP